ncbi:hypothetical protein D1H68_002866 [Escherichia coli]|nr:hypothetical protein [Escherichia coli]EHK9711918.1 hypothetical protein [Escherichia coli]EJS7461510.1 hypothetical protein [Escherichia coli]EJX7566985.1 hypothetical protein [Escherichia coli]
MSIKNDGHYFCRAGGNRPDGLNEPVTQILPDMLINFALINITDRKNEGTNTIDGNWQADEGRRYRDNVRIYF